MRIVLIGYGKMGHEIEKVARQRGHEIVCTIDIDTQDRFASEAFLTADLAMEFTGPQTAYGNYLKCFAAGLPVVSGSTGWLDKMPLIRRACQEEGQTFFYASNFSLGVNLLFALNRFLAEKMNAFPQYDVCMKEIHHTQKLDAPSGTAVTLAEDVIGRIDRKSSWVNHPTENPDQIGIVSERIGTTPGYHEVVYDSEVDTLTISHNAKNRTGLALGAVLAAEFTLGKKGLLGMQDLLGF
ncbi:MAG: 4-hydroxy-tetrahydrodipicolinate reductase [Bacteroidales bacterium]|nr:4-hydroxy-tetrahydrodipicolinate reductase [Bacteroidales bacterium]